MQTCFSSSVLKLDRKFKSSWKVVALCLVPSEQKLLKSNNITCSLTDFSIKWWITYHQTITASQWYISFQVLCDYEQLEHLILTSLEFCSFWFWLTVHLPVIACLTLVFEYPCYGREPEHLKIYSSWFVVHMYRW